MKRTSPFALLKPFCSLAILSCSFFVTHVQAEAEAIRSVEGISEYQLDNGLQVLLFPDPSKETVTVNVTYRVGSKHENYGETGMAHLLEHLVFKGTPKHKDIPQELSSHGARPNGTTWTDRTNYYETFSATEENINWALDMEADRMINSFIAQKDLDSEMTVVRNEFERGENSPFSVTLERLMSSAYSWHNYGKSTIGARSDIENVSIASLKAFYKKYYQPDNATLIVAGKFDEKAMIKKVERYFSSIPKPQRSLAPLYTQEPAQDGERSVTVRRVGDVQLYTSGYHVPAGSHPDFAALEVLSGILGDTPRGRLHKNVVEKKLASRTFGFSFQWAEPGLMLFAAQVDQTGDLDQAAETINNIVESIEQHPIQDDEVERTKRKLIKSFELGFNSSENIALQLSEWLGMGDWRLMFLNRDRIEQVSTADVQRVAQLYLQRNNRTSGRFIPTKEAQRVEIPKVENVAAMLKGYKGKASIAQGELFEPSFDNIDERSQISNIGEHLKVSLLPKKTRGEMVTVNIALNFGDEKSLLGHREAANAVGAMLSRGTSRYTREQLQDEFDKLKMAVSIAGSASGASVKISTKRENLAKALALAAHVLKEPSFDKKEFEQYLATRKVDLEQNLQNPQSLAFREYSRLHRDFKPDHPYYVPNFAEAIQLLDELELRQLRSFHEKFYGSGFGEIAIIGDFDSEATKTQLEELFGHWDAKASYVRIQRPYRQIPSVRKSFDTPDKENAVFVATVSLPLSDEHEDSPALVLGEYILGGGFLNSRLATRLRQEDGLSYSAGSFLNQSPLDERSALGIYAICAPQNLTKVEQGFKDVIQAILDKGFTDDEIEAAKSGLLQGTLVSRAQDAELSAKLNSNAYLGRSMQWSESFEQRLKELGPEDVHRVMTEYLKLKEFAIITGADARKAL